MKMKKTVVKIKVFLLMGINAYSPIKVYCPGAAAYFHAICTPFKITSFFLSVCC